jgi:uncharacterized protein YecE (DUF72 family)
VTGHLFTGTSGFSYPAWMPRFYPPDTPRDGLIAAYATRLNGVELSSTYRRVPTAEQVAAWVSRVPAGFRFTVKLQLTLSARAFLGDPDATLSRLVAPLPGFGAHLGAALFRIHANRARDDERLERLLAAWPAGVPLAIEAQDPSWHVDETFDRLRAAGAVMVVTETDDAVDPPLTITGPFVYLRLRRTAYGTADLDEWAARIEPFLADGRDAYVFFRHDEQGATPLLAEALAARLR